VDINTAIITTLSYVSVLGVIGIMINRSQVTQDINQQDICHYSGLPSTSTYKKDK